MGYRVDLLSKFFSNFLIGQVLKSECDNWIENMLIEIGNYIRVAINNKQ